MGNDYAARKQRRKDSKRNRDDEAPKRIRKKKTPRRICRGECYKQPSLDLDSSDEDMIATVKARNISLVSEKAPHELQYAVQETKSSMPPYSGKDGLAKRKEKKKMSTSSQLIIPKAASLPGDERTSSMSEQLKYHPVITMFMAGGKIASALPLQKICWPVVLQGKNVYVTAQPGSGKTLSYLLPIACKLIDGGHSMATRPTAPLAMVLLPTRELAQQVASVCKLIKRHCNIPRVSCLTGGSHKGKQVDSLKRCPHIIVATPGRLVDMLEDNALSLEKIDSVILDEADKMLSLGFSDQIEKIRTTLISAGVRLPSDSHTTAHYSSTEDEDGEDSRTDRTPCHVGLYSATDPPGVSQISKLWCGQPTKIDLAAIAPKNSDQSSTKNQNEKTDNDATLAQISKNVVQAVHVCAEHKKMNKLTKHLSNIEALHKEKRHKPKILVFANRIKTVKYLARELRGQNKKVAEIHGDKSQEEREAAIRDFKGGKFNILVASDVASRGLHVKNLSYVVNYDFPSNLETYIHRVGRTGRVDAEGHAFSFFTRTLAPLASPLIELLESHGQEIDPNLVKLAESYKIVEQKLKEEGQSPAGLEKGALEKKKIKTKVTRDSFIPSLTFTGAKLGYIFTKGSQGIGYYLDAPRFSKQRPKIVKQVPTKKASKVQRILPGKLARMQRRGGVPDDE